MIRFPAGYDSINRIKRYQDYYQASYGVMLLSAGQFSPASLFSSGEQGAWYDPSDFSTMFQDAAGTTPVTAVEQPVGLLLDKSKGLAPGAELVTNGDFSSGTGWTLGTGATISGGKLNLSAASGYVLYRNSVAGVQVGGYYEVTFTVSGYISGSIRPYLGSTATFGTTVSANGTYTQRFGPTAGGEVGFNSASAFTGAIDDLSVKALTGNHASQSTAASRPVLSARVNQLTYSEQFDNAAWTKYTGSITNTGITDPLGGSTADAFTSSGANGAVAPTNGITVSANTDYTFSVWLKVASGTNTTQIGIVSSSLGGIQVSNVTVTTGWQRFSVSGSVGVNTSIKVIVGGNNTIGTGVVVHIWGADLRVTNVGVNLPEYQRVAAATDYDTTGFPLYLRSDGVDDRLIGPAISNLVSSSAYEACVGARVLAVSTSNASPWMNETLLADSLGYVGVGYMTTSNIIGAYNYDANSDTATQSMTPPSTFVLQQRHDGGNLVLSLNGGSEASAASGNTTSTIGDTRIFSSNGSLSVSANLYGLIIRSTAFTAAERANVLTYVNNLTKAY